MDTTATKAKGHIFRRCGLVPLFKLTKYFFLILAMLRLMEYPKHYQGILNNCKTLRRSTFQCVTSTPSRSDTNKKLPLIINQQCAISVCFSSSEPLLHSAKRPTNLTHVLRYSPKRGSQCHDAYVTECFQQLFHCEADWKKITNKLKINRQETSFHTNPPTQVYKQVAATNFCGLILR